MRTAYGGEAKKLQASERAVRRGVYNNLTTGFTSTVDVEKSLTLPHLRRGKANGKLAENAESKAPLFSPGASSASSPRFVYFF